MESCLRVERVSKAYAGIVALREISLDVAKGQIFALLGPNGSGKTTLVKIITTLLAKDAGRVLVQGHDVDKEEMRVRELIGYVGQDSERSAYARLTVRENLRFFGALRGLTRGAADKAIDMLATHFGFDRELDQLFMSLSGGQKQTAVILRALMANPPLIVLDEPTKGLDPVMARRIRTFLARFVRETDHTILLTSHALSEVDELSDRVLLMHAGVIAVEGTAAKLKSETGWQGILEIPGHLLTAELDLALLRAGNNRRADGPTGWVSYGLKAGRGNFAATMDTLAGHELERAYRYRPVSLEDAFEDLTGRLSERFEP
jgi:ABC-2 type transport system ATP-binding protein